MDSLTLEQKQAQFAEYFMIHHSLRINIALLPKDASLPPEDQLADHMPYAFRMASELATIDAQALRPLRNLSDHASDLADYLNHQARKIDLMMSYILQQQDDPSQRFETIQFGGGGVVIRHSEPMQIGLQAELKLFLPEESAAIYCFGEVIACQQESDDYHIAFIFNRIREQDQELLVRASLHLQTMQLRKRAQHRQSPDASG
ncbi:PilZ domain-containing protein [Alteromonas aestuariivivens]|uniref:PilZ domain-containing protein n=1 Tax=Alteromonas aestuariivivens TaxID=1938339 RepID=A0A3D8MAT5_9ALTE|nr:PilZ domain-containing protein [Alteromonas aestuariivivens]RDV27484.1 PilZ domain-containing protein [Alteromonas aestuariivivens]